ncbi:mesencephalic astrocyte-derived neurotrophic factor homolog [Acanthaster planci]|uniref:Mesencephalic astrocyte-derived neurotrophic factor homolog n=1 Tax=Acanthaster planci TaxID=133434 RepID=A0A8B7ZAK8_ACAPL|nr:mesencephalic astrocyte-derived neurotrophic factor homolog [Acanthaster planci]
MNVQAFTMASFVYLALVVCAVVLHSAEAKLKKGECEVCIETLNKIEKAITKKQRDEGKEGIEKAIRKFCKSAKTKENTFCYFIGGTADAATGSLGEISKRLLNYVPSDKICERLNKLDSQICELEYEKQIDLDSVDLKKMKVKELKNILSVWGEECKACTEKTDFIKRIEELKPKYYKKKTEL